MKTLAILYLFVFASMISGQANNSVVLNLDYDKMPIDLQIDNSGIYGVSHFDIYDDKIFLYDFNRPIAYEYKNNVLLSSKSLNNTLSKKTKSPFNSHTSIQINNSLTYDFENALLKNNNEEHFEIVVQSNNLLTVNYIVNGICKEFSIQFPGDLAYANLIGVDRNSIIFLVVERFLQQVPLKVYRKVYTVDNQGNVLSILNLPDIKYLFTLSDLRVDEDGNLYHMLTTENSIEIIKWQGLNKRSNSVVKYPTNYNYHLHFNEHLPSTELKTIQALGKNSSATRPMSLRIAEGYVYHKYNCSSANLAPTNVTAPDGDVVRTPERLIVGRNARIPYKWGGFNTLNQFDQGLLDGKFAGDINTNGVSAYAVGVDCSGFVSRCWQLSYHASTSYMPNITTQYSNWAHLKPGDAVHKVGHVRLYVSTQPNGSIKIVESTSRGWGVSYWSYAPSDLTNYTPRYYQNMSDDYYENQPELISVLEGTNNEVSIKWECDGAELKGYRLYRSPDRISWSLIGDENTLQEKFAKDTLEMGAFYYRVSSVRNNPPYLSESDLSNELAIGKSESTGKYIVIDGFERESGSWRGAGHKFAGRYGKSLFKNDVNFESIKSRFLSEPEFNLGNYSGVLLISGDESTVDETFNTYEQTVVKNYLESGGRLFVTGSEIGWDLDHKGTSADKSFYNNYLKADYMSDDAGAQVVSGEIGSFLEDCIFHIGQTYDEDYPDEISPFGGSSICMRYSNNKVAGIEYTGTFGNSSIGSKLIYLAFPLETTASDEEFDSVLMKTLDYFNETIISVDNNSAAKFNFYLAQNYPNPFNPITKIKYSIDKASLVSLTVYNSLGEELKTLVNSYQEPGKYGVAFDAKNHPSGIYYYSILADNYAETKKMILLK